MDLPKLILDSVSELIRRGADSIAGFVLGVVVTIFLAWYFPFRWFLRRGRRQDDAKEVEREKERERQQDTVESLTRQLEELTEVRSDLDRLTAALRDQIQIKTEERTRLEEEVRSLTGQVSELSEQIQWVANFDGKIWEKPAVVPVPEFRPLHARRVPIVSITNLKGGVGKTTITANLGAALWSKGYRVLMLDLDYQGSLTSLCLPREAMEEIRRGERFVETLLRLDGPPKHTLLRDAMRLPGGKGYLLAAREELADVEMQTMAKWLVESGDDARYLLRKALHSSEVTDEFDIILLDCPPRLTTSCINALASSDFVLIPVLLDRTSVEAAPRLLHWLRKLRSNVCPDLAVLGVIGNRAYPRQELIARERQVWEDLSDKLKQAWGESVHQFATIIRQDSKFAEAASNQTFAALDPKLEATFQDLVNELHRRIPLHEGRRSPAFH